MPVIRFSIATADDAEERRFQLPTFPHAVTRLKCFRKIAVLESRMSLTRLPRGQPSLAPPIIWTNVPGGCKDWPCASTQPLRPKAVWLDERGSARVSCDGGTPQGVWETVFGATPKTATGTVALP